MQNKRTMIRGLGVNNEQGRGWGPKGGVDWGGLNTPPPTTMYLKGGEERGGTLKCYMFLKQEKPEMDDFDRRKT